MSNNVVDLSHDTGVSAETSTAANTRRTLDENTVATTFDNPLAAFPYKRCNENFKSCANVEDKLDEP